MSAIPCTDFVPYPKMPDSTKKWALDESQMRKLRRCQWVVTEKIHGANCTALTDGAQVQWGKRKSLLDEDDDFFSYRRVASRMQMQILALFPLLEARLSRRLRHIQIYGELCGGHYPHPDVAAIEGVQAIQTGVYYSPEIQYIPFDIAVVYPHSDIPTYLDYATVMSCLDEVALPYAKPLLIGTYDQALQVDPVFESTIPALLGMPALPSPNLAEGVVCKVLDAITLEGAKGPFRPIIKRKASHFQEDKRYHQATKWKSSHNVTNQASTMAQLQHSVDALLTPQRRDNAISKIGRIKTAKQKRQLLALFSQDIQDQLQEDHPTLFARLSSNESTQLIAQIRKNAQDFLTKHGL